MDSATRRRNAAIARYNEMESWYLLRRAPYLTHRAEAMWILQERANASGYMHLDVYFRHIKAAPDKPDSGRLPLRNKQVDVDKRARWITFIISGEDLSPELDAYVDSRDLFALTDDDVALLRDAIEQHLDYGSLPTKTHLLLTGLRDKQRNMWVAHKNSIKRGSKHAA